MVIRKSVLVTGASSGIGKECALHLDKLGFKVFAGVRTEEAKEKLQKGASDKFRPIILDVTKVETIKTAVELIAKEQEYPLFALVNNAGIGLRGVLEVTPEEELRKLLEVNVIGLHAVTKAFLPLLRKNKGRIVNMGSENSFTAGPGGSSYAASKFAVRAISDSLRLELLSFGMSVSLIAPTSTKSDIWKKNRIYRDDLHKSITSELYEVYKFFLKSEEKINVDNIKTIAAEEVAKSVAHALISKKPKYEYLVGKKARKAYRFSKLPKSIAIGHTIRRLTKYMERTHH
jgi:short-subunit dehydrogenase